MGTLKMLFLFLVSMYMFFFLFGVPGEYTLRVKAIREIGNRQSGMLFNEDSLRKELQKYYGSYILQKPTFGWFPFNAGGLHGSVSVLYSSFNEFLVLYHSEMETTGSTGRHFMNISTTVLHGEMSYYRDTTTLQKSESMTSGDNYVLRAGTSATVKLSAGTTLLVYGRGFVPLTMGYWVSHALFVSHDPMLALSTILLFIKACAFTNGTSLHWVARLLGQLWKFVAGFFDYLILLPQEISKLVQYMINGASKLSNGIFKP